MMVRHGLDMSKPPKPEKPSTLTTTPFKKSIGSYSNYIDIENGDEYWISGLKKGESNRHWAGHGKIKIDRRAVAEYLALIGEKELPQNLFEVVEIEDRFPVERIHRLLNERGEDGNPAEEDETNSDCPSAV